MNTCRVGFGYSSFHLKCAEDVGKRKKAGSGNTLVARAALLVAFLSPSAHSAPFFFLSRILLAAKVASTEDFIIDSFSGGSRPSDKVGGGGHPDPAIRGEAVSKKYIFPPLRASVWSKNKGEVRAPQTPPLDPPLSLWYTKLVHRTKCVSHKAFLKVLSCISDLLIYCNYIRFIMF